MYGRLIAFCSAKPCKTSYSYRAYIDIRPGGIAFCSAKPCKKCYSYRAYICVGPGGIAFCSAKPCKSYSSRVYIDIEPGRIVFCSAKPCIFYAASMSRASWSKLEASSGVTARNWSLPRALGLGQPSGVIHVVGGQDVLHGRVLAALLGPEERVLQHPARAAREAVGCAARDAHGQPRRCRRANSRHASQRSSNAAAPSARPPRYRQAPPTPSTLNGLRRATLHLLRALASSRRSTSLGRPMICGRLRCPGATQPHPGAAGRKACAAANPAAPAPMSA